MNCDQVFDTLTQGPFPTGQPLDAQVERHIACCHECRQMAEALRPAVDLFHESIVEWDQAPLPEYRGQAGTSTVETLPEVVEACLASPNLQPRLNAASGRSMSPTLWRKFSCMSAAVLAVVGVVFLVLAVLPNSDSLSDHALLAGGPASKDKLSDSPTGMALLQLSEACFQDGGLNPSAVTPANGLQTASKGLRCCTLCHNAANRNRPKIDSIALLEKSCRGCHSY